MRRTLLLIASLAAARLIYIFLLCPYDLVEDEANYWEWSRHLDWSYYTKGPGIAWAIRAATELLGTSEAAIRVVAVVSNTIATLAVALLAGLAVSADDTATAASPKPLRIDPRVAFFAACAFQLSPIFQATGILSTIDGPYTACWAVACLASFVALKFARPSAWILAGAALGIGFLFKYTILLLLPGILLFAVLARTRLALGTHWRRHLFLGLVLMLGAFAPVVVWNQNNGWPTVAHLLGHLGLPGGDMPLAHVTSQNKGWNYNPLWTVNFIGSQFGMVGPLLALALCASLARFRQRRNSALPPAFPIERPLRALAARHSDAVLFLISCAAPILVFYFVVSFLAEPEGNWAMGAYVSLLALAGWGASLGMAAFHEKVLAWRARPLPRPREGVLRKKPETVVQVLWHFGVVFGVLTGLGMLRLDWIMAAGIPIAKAVAPVLGVKPEKISSGRAMNMFQADRMGRSAHHYAHDILKRDTGLEPFYVAQHYGTSATLAFYIPGRPTVLCSSSRMGGRRTPWDFWPDTDLNNPQLLGRPALLAGAQIEQWMPMFERVVPVDSPNAQLDGENKKGRPAFLGYGYKGLPAP